MSLAPPATGDGARTSSFLPAIKCSNCSQEIEIASMGEHMCTQVVPQPEPFRDYSASTSSPYALPPSSPPHTQHVPMPPMPPMPDASEARPSQSPARARAPTLASNPDAGVRAPRAPPPRINPDAANKPFLAKRFDSPLSPPISVRSASSNGVKPSMSRSATSPMPRRLKLDPPSPELSANIDCAFPPFPDPVANNGRPSTSNGRRTPGEGAQSRVDHGLRPNQGVYDLEPKSPRLNAGESVLQRLNTLKSGPFNAKKPKSSSGDSKPGSFWFGKRRPSDSPARATPVPAIPVSGPAANPVVPGASFPETRPGPSQIARITSQDVFSPTFLDQFSAEPSDLPFEPSPLQTSTSAHDLERSQTYPSLDENPSKHLVPEPLSKVHSEPTLPNPEASSSLSPFQLSEVTVTPSNPPQQHKEDPEHDALPEQRSERVPPAPKSVQQHRQESIHAPSESGFSTVSSSNSANHSHGGSSRRPSPVTSAASSIDTLSPLSYDPNKYTDDAHMRVPDLTFKTQETAAAGAEEARAKTPPYFARPVIQARSPPAAEAPLSMPLESPMDPALQSDSGVASITRSDVSPTGEVMSPANNMSRPLRRGPMPAAPPLVMPNDSNGFHRPRAGPPPPGSWQPGRRNGGPPRIAPNDSPVPRMQTPISARSPATPLDPRMGPGSRRANGAKAICRGCAQPIEGKSVKASDGRLTGRWHKACFVCRTCREPFTTADFYVINNEPYCEQHYHEHNDSICAGCHRGIEGQYVETSSTRRPGPQNMKFHPRCFTCWECRTVLADDYFEIQGKMFCERHALAAMRAQARSAGGGVAGNPSNLGPPNARGLNAERRTTRLMMMA